MCSRQDGNLQDKLRRLQGKAALEFRHLMDANIDMSEVVANAKKTAKEVGLSATMAHLVFSLLRKESP
jgi:uncharacterized protein YceH (UPF0502 family)